MDDFGAGIGNTIPPVVLPGGASIKGDGIMKSATPRRAARPILQVEQKEEKTPMYDLGERPDESAPMAMPEEPGYPTFYISNVDIPEISAMAADSEFTVEAKVRLKSITAKDDGSFSYDLEVRQLGVCKD